jgi:hypothetical protein
MQASVLDGFAFDPFSFQALGPSTLPDEGGRYLWLLAATQSLQEGLQSHTCAPIKFRFAERDAGFTAVRLSACGNNGKPITLSSKRANGALFALLEISKTLMADINTSPAPRHSRCFPWG